METQLNVASRLTVTADGTVVTEDGLALKNLGRVEIIDSRIEKRIDATFHSWQICRSVRRDFNFIASKMFFRCTRPGGGEQVRSMVQEVRLHAELLASSCASFETNPVEDVRVVPLRLISAVSSSLYRAMICADLAMAKLNYAVATRKIGPDEIFDYSRDFDRALADLKMFVASKDQANRSARDLGVAQGIS